MNKFIVGFVLTMTSLWFLFDSVRVSTGGHGFISGAIHDNFNSSAHGSNAYSASMGLIFIPFILGIISIVYSNGKRWSWYLTWTGLAVIVVEMMSRIRFMMNLKSSYLILVMLMFSVGVGLMLKSATQKDEIS
jgi:hypothetical protein